MSETLQYIATVFCEDDSVLEEALVDIALCVEEYLSDRKATVKVDIDTAGSTITFDIDKKELYRSKLMKYTSITEEFTEHEVMVARLLPFGHSEVWVSCYIEWEIPRPLMIK